MFSQYYPNLNLPVAVSDNGTCLNDTHCNPNIGVKCINYVCTCEEVQLIRNAKCQPR